MENDSEGRERLLRLGVRHLPVLVKGEQLLSSKNMEFIAEFAGLRGIGHIPLPPQELFEKWITILRAAQRYACQLPNDQMNLRALQIRNRPTWQLGNHIFSIGLAYLECVVGGAKNLTDLQKTFQSFESDRFTSGEEIARYGDEVIVKIEQWWNGLADKSCRRSIEIDNYGVMSVHQLLDRCTWHSAHHARQIADLLESQGIEPDGKFSEHDLAGLPLPKRIWD